MQPADSSHLHAAIALLEKTPKLLETLLEGVSGLLRDAFSAPLR